MAVYKNYPGGKNGSGTYQTIINEIRPHVRFISGYLGNCGIVQHIRPADTTIGVDVDPGVISEWKKHGPASIQLHNTKCIDFLQTLSFPAHQRTVIYLDPPYPRGSRKSSNDLYKFEMTDTEHEELLTYALTLPCDVLISTYPNDLYSDYLEGWRCISFEAITRGGSMATELVYMNYENPSSELHDYAFLGDDYRERERIKKKLKREIAKLNKLNAFERNAILSAIVNQNWEQTNSILRQIPPDVAVLDQKYVS